MAKHFIFLGLPGVGKGTFATLICNQLKGWKHISVGDLLRSEVKMGTALGKEVNSYMAKGSLVPDNIVTEVAIHHVKQSIATSASASNLDSKTSVTLILDGFPRTVGQAEALSRECQNLSFDVINIQMERWVAVKKLLGRVSCNKCGKNFNTCDIVTQGYEMPAILPTQETCPHGLASNICSSFLVDKRNDDNEETIARRFDLYEAKTAPVVQYYKNKNMLKDFWVKRGIADTKALIDVMSS